jgi:hypothetical protein
VSRVEACASYLWWWSSLHHRQGNQNDEHGGLTGEGGKAIATCTSAARVPCIVQSRPEGSVDFSKISRLIMFKNVPLKIAR